MLYLYLDDNHIKLLFLKKTLLGQFEASFFDKKHEIDLLAKGKVTNVDLLASAIKEGLTHLNAISEKQVFLILPQESFVFMKADIPIDIAPSAINSFIKDKAKVSLPIDIENHFYDYFIKETNKQQQVTLFAIDADAVAKYHETLNLLGLKISSLLPESLAIFKLFEKTLRREKKENIFYLSVAKDELSGYLYDSGGLYSDEKWVKKISGGEQLADVLKEKKEELEQNGMKLNRIILSGEQSAGVRQDTFTKEVGVWTNPLKRIIPDFYQEYLRMLVVPSNMSLPILGFDVCIGAFIFSQENKEFQVLKKTFKEKEKFSIAMPKLPILNREVLIFVVSALLSFGVFFALLKLNFKFTLPNFAKKQEIKPVVLTPTTPLPTPTPNFKKETLKIKVLNGSGTKGKASEVKDLLVKKGYADIVTDNADNFDFTQTVIAVKKSLNGLADQLKKDLADSVSSPKIDILPEKENSDVIITVGSDLK